MSRGIRVVAVCFLLVMLAASIVGPVTGSASAETTTRVVTASGADASGLLRPSGSRAAMWRTKSVRGATVITRFAAPTEVNGTRIIAAATTERVADARLQFSDGSTLAVHTNGRGDRSLSFTPRKVRWVRLVVSEVVPGQKSVGLARWTLRRGASNRLLAERSAARPSAVITSSGSVSGTRWTASSRGSGQWVELRWRRSAELSAVRISGGAQSTATTIRTGSLRFSDGSTVLVRSLEPKGGAPTTIAFTPRVTTSVRFVATSVYGGAAAAVQSIRAYPVGVVPSEPAASSTTYKSAWSPAGSCTGAKASGPSSSLGLVCPTNGSEVGRRLQIVLAGPSGAAVTVAGWRPSGTGGSIGVVARSRFSTNGSAHITVPTARLLHGPAAIRITAAGVATPLYVQFVNTSGVTQKVRSSSVTKGMDLKYDESFSKPLSATRTGANAVYASGKPNYYGVDDFGEAIFAQPNGTPSTESTMPGGYLRIPARALAKGHTDPAGYGRTSSGGLLSSGHAGGSGFSAQFGYFEARMLGPAGAGTWPAFWLLSTGSLVGGGSTAEVDAVELYGNDPHTAFQTSHSWVSGRSTGSSVAPAVSGSGDWALNWHTYGARVTPTGIDYYVDGIHSGHTPPVVHANEPFFFLVNLALKENWKSGLSGTGDRVDLYVDSIRVWV